MKNKALPFLISAPFLVGGVTALFLFSLAPQQPVESEFSLLERAFTGLIALVIVLIITRRLPSFFIVPIPLVILLLVMGISLFQMPAAYIVQDYLAFALFVIFSIVAISSVGSQTIINAVAISGILLLLSTTLFTLVFPESAFYNQYELKGAFFGPNSTGLSVLFVVPALASSKFTKRIATYLFRTIGLVWAFGIIVATTSRTALIVFVLMMFFWATIVLLRRFKVVSFILLGSGISLIILGLSNVALITSAFGKSSDISGRLPLWNAYFNAISLEPFTGYGWHVRTTVEMPLGNLIQMTFGQTLIHANNDLINWWALTGIFGVVLATISLLSLIIWGYIARRYALAGQWGILSGATLLTAGFTELTSMTPDGFMILSLSTVSVGYVIIDQMKSRNVATLLIRRIFFTKLPGFSFGEKNSKGFRQTS